MSNEKRFFVAITGAQGVGKSTFSRELASILRTTLGEDVLLLDDLGATVAAMGVPLGSSSTTQTISAVWTTHLEREDGAPGRLVLLDRCVVDALAYTRVLDLGTDLDQRLFEAVARLSSSRLSLVIHLQLSDFFADRGASHETPQHRQAVARQIIRILADWHVPKVEVDAAAEDAVEMAAQAVLAAYRDSKGA